MEEKEQEAVVMHGEYVSELDLERFDSSDSSTASSPIVGPCRRPSIMLRGTGLRAFMAGVAMKATYVVQDASSHFKSSLRNDAEEDLGQKYLGWPPPELDTARETAWLDGLRGIAAFLVMATHYNTAWLGMNMEAPYAVLKDREWELWRLPIVRVLMASGHTQVSIFFVLSGFVLSWGPLAHIRNGRGDKINQTLASAAFRRWMRLFLPCFIIGLYSILEIQLDILQLAVERRSNIFSQFWDYLGKFEHFANPFFLDRANIDATNVYATVMWTIPIEWAGSLLVFGVLLITSRIRRYEKRTLVNFGIALYAYISARWNYWLFATGILLADYVREAGGFEQLSRRMESRQSYRIFGYGMFFIGLLLAGLPSPNHIYWSKGYDFLYGFVPDSWMRIEGGARFWWSWAGVILLTCACHIRGWKEFCELPFIRYLGRISFMLYLTHCFVLETLSRAVRNSMFRSLGWEIYDEEQKSMVWTGEIPTVIFIFFVLWILIGGAAILVAHWCQVLVDEPCVRLAKWVDQQFVDDSAFATFEEKQPPVLPT